MATKSGFHLTLLRAFFSEPTVFHPFRPYDRFRPSYSFHPSYPFRPFSVADEKTPGRSEACRANAFGLLTDLASGCRANVAVLMDLLLRHHASSSPCQPAAGAAARLLGAPPLPADPAAPDGACSAGAGTGVNNSVARGDGGEATCLFC